MENPSEIKNHVASKDCQYLKDLIFGGCLFHGKRFFLLLSYGKRFFLFSSMYQMPNLSLCFCMCSLVLKYLIALEKTRMLKMYYKIVTFGDNIQVSNHSATDYCINKTQFKQKILV